ALRAPRRAARPRASAQRSGLVRPWLRNETGARQDAIAVPLSDARQPLRSLRLERADIALVAQRDRDVVETFEEPRARELVKGECRPKTSGFNGRALDVDRDARRRIPAHRVDELRERVRVGLDRHEPVAERVVPED